MEIDFIILNILNTNKLKNSENSKNLNQDLTMSNLEYIDTRFEPHLKNPYFTESKFPSPRVKIPSFRNTFLMICSPRFKTSDMKGSIPFDQKFPFPLKTTSNKFPIDKLNLSRIDENDTDIEDKKLKPFSFN